MGDIDGAIESYHQALSMKPDDTFSGEMLNRALHESFSNPDPLLSTSAKPENKDVSKKPRQSFQMNLSESFVSNKSSGTYDLDSDAEYNEDSRRQSTMSFATGTSSNLSIDCSDVDMSLS